mmetsp:Transcript_39490/g.83045  ORF Transcript_39490/g.83045 Transcript_39490/m.83045 type:complete len:684 (+) Transcript_39490:548-2599(+)
MNQFHCLDRTNTKRMETMLPCSPKNGGAERNVHGSPGRTVCGALASSPRLGGWLSGLGSPGRSPSYSSRRHSVAIADDIRNDQELFFADDEPPPILLPPLGISSSSAAAAAMSHQHQHQKSLAATSRQGYRSILEPPTRRNSSHSAPSSNLLPRRSSHQKMENLQREVDLALEFFSQETEDELDHFDGDGYLHRHVDSKLPRVFGGDLGASCCDGSDDVTPSTAATSMVSSVVTTDDDAEFTDCHTKLLSFSEQCSSNTDPSSSAEEPSRITGAYGGLLPQKHKTKSILSLPLSLLPSQTALNCSTEEEENPETLSPVIKFENVIAEELNQMSITEDYHHYDGIRNVDFNASASLRNAMEPFLAVARLRREEARQRVFDTLDKVMMPHEPHECASRRMSSTSSFSFHIGSTYGVPYPALRCETPFLYDVESFPLSSVLSETLGVEDLSKIHMSHPLKKDKSRLMAPLRNRGKRRKFHQCFDSFVTSHVIPLLHAQALSKGVFYTNRHQLQKGKPQAIIYRYQRFPSINIVRPGECSTDPHCDMAQGHSIGNISYHIPMTATYGTNAVYTESRPGREDWHPLVTKSPGLGFQFDGARCLHFNLKNETDITRVSLNFRIAITRAPESCAGYDPDDLLCCPELLRDDFSKELDFYDEVVVNVGDVPRSFMPGPVAMKRKGGISVVG